MQKMVFVFYGVSHFMMTKCLLTCPSLKKHFLIIWGVLLPRIPITPPPITSRSHYTSTRKNSLEIFSLTCMKHVCLLMKILHLYIFK